MIAAWRPLSRLAIPLAPLLVFGVLVIYTYAYFFQAPYSGFTLNPSDMSVMYVHSQASLGEPLLPGDQLISFDGLRLADLPERFDQPLFSAYRPGEVLDLVFERGGRRFATGWVFTGPTQAEIFTRLIGIWWLPYAFFIAGAIMWLYGDIRKLSWLLLAGSHFVTSLWLSTGVVSQFQVWHATPLFHFLIWIQLPIALHLHWIFPSSLGRIHPALSLLYPAAFIIGIIDALGWISDRAFTMAALANAFGVLALLLTQAARNRKQRRVVFILFSITGVALAPPIALALSGPTEGYPALADSALLSMPLMAGAYLVAVFRQQVPGFELRANRWTSAYMFVVLIAILLVGGSLILDRSGSAPARGSLPVIVLFTTVITAFMTIVLYRGFQSFIDRRIYGIQPAPTYLLDSYVGRLMAAANKRELGNIVSNELLPALGVTRSVLYRIYIDKEPEYIVHRLGESDALPPAASIGSWNNGHSGKTPELSWIRLLLPMSAANQTIGAWILGPRDPDDYFSFGEVQVLQTITNQIAIALNHLDEVEHLHALFQSNVDLQEAERQHLAMELHDEVLNQLGLMVIEPHHVGEPLSASQVYHNLTMRLRSIITGLRPTMLNYGLRAALDELSDEILDLSNDRLQVLVKIENEPAELPADVELHIFRIIQEACRNTLKHSRARNIIISGRLSTNLINITIDDDGEGFEVGDHPDLEGLVSAKHFGLAGMYERAKLINAMLHLSSAPGQGTHLTIWWRDSH